MERIQQVTEPVTLKDVADSREVRRRADLLKEQMSEAVTHPGLVQRLLWETSLIGSGLPPLTVEQQAELDHAYGYHAPTPEQVKLYEAINRAAKFFEVTVLQCCPSSADRSAAQRQIRDARMTANRSIALHRPEKGSENRPWAGPDFAPTSDSRVG